MKKYKCINYIVFNNYNFMNYNFVKVWIESIESVKLIFCFLIFGNFLVKGKILIIKIIIYNR